MTCITNPTEKDMSFGSQDKPFPIGSRLTFSFGIQRIGSYPSKEQDAVPANQRVSKEFFLQDYPLELLQIFCKSKEAYLRKSGAMSWFSLFCNNYTIK